MYRIQKMLLFLLHERTFHDTRHVAIITLSMILLIGNVAPAASGPALPGDVAAAAETPLVAAHSMTRAMYANYKGSLFQVQRASDSATKDIGVTGPGGAVDIDALNLFCSGTTGSVAILYDQSGNGNDLKQETPIYQPDIRYWPVSNGTLVPMAASTHHQWLRNREHTARIPKGSEGQSLYWVIQGIYANKGCCYNYGNMATRKADLGAGTMNALCFSACTRWSTGTGTGPWAQIDFESGIFAGAAKLNPNNPTTIKNVVTQFSKTNGTTSWVLKVGDGTEGPLTTCWNGALPPGYSPLKQKGGLSLGEGGDGLGGGNGAFFEGAVIQGVTSDATEDAIQAGVNRLYGTKKVSAFTPAADPSLEAWWDGSDTATMTFGADTSVEKWVDKSSHHYAATQATASRQPVFIPKMLNGKGGLRFSRADTTILTSVDKDDIFAHGFSIFYVIQPVTLPKKFQAVLAQATADSGEPGLGFTNVLNEAPLAIAEFGHKKAGGTLTNTIRAPYIDEFVSEVGAPRAGGPFTVIPYVNGTAGGALSVTIAHPYTPTGLHIGSNRFNDYFDGYIYEIVVSTDTSAATRQKYENYFACKYGMLGFLPSEEKKGDKPTRQPAP